MTRRKPLARLVAAFAVPVFLACGGLARAQLVLPGAVSPSAPPTFAPPAGGAGKPAGAPADKGARRDSGVSTPAEGRAAALKPPGDDAIAGRTFLRNGAEGAMAIEKSGAALQLSRLVLTGYLISRPAEACRVEIGGGPIALTPAERHDGLLSYSVALEACPFAIDVLDGAALARGPVCEFKAADCKIDPSGFWGPDGASFGPEAAKSIEKARATAEAESRGQFRALLAANRQNRVRTKEIAGQQASFSSIRAQICQNYAAEDKHGYCASRITMAHAVALSAELHGAAAEAGKGAGAPVKRKPRPKPKPAAGTVETAPPATPLR
jgi:hypothetical protein